MGWVGLGGGGVTYSTWCMCAGWQGWFECMLGPDGQPNPAGMRSSIVAHFVDYAELLFREFAGKVWTLGGS